MSIGVSTSEGYVCSLCWWAVHQKVWGVWENLQQLGQLQQIVTQGPTGPLYIVLSGSAWELAWASSWTETGNSYFVDSSRGRRACNEKFSITSLKFVCHYFPTHAFTSVEMLCLLSFEALSALIQALHPRAYMPYSQPQQTLFLSHFLMPNSTSSMMAHQNLTNSVDNSVSFLSNIILMLYYTLHFIILFPKLQLLL